MASQQLGKLAGVTNRFGIVLRAHPLPFHGTPLFYIFRFKGDAVAAFPSEHAAFPLIELLAFSRVCGKVVTFGLSIWVLFVLFTVIYLGEHWVIDAIAGYVYALAIFGSVSLLIRAPAR
jgi:membrane-associated phospholipid phosphatase